MKNILLPALVVGSVFLFSFDNTILIKVLPTFSEKQIEQTEKLVETRFGNKVDIQVLKRSRKKGIISIKAQRYYADGREGGSCSSDDFGYMEIMPTGFRITDRGHEND